MATSQCSFFDASGQDQTFTQVQAKKVHDDEAMEDDTHVFDDAMSDLQPSDTGTKHHLRLSLTFRQCQVFVAQ